MASIQDLVNAVNKVTTLEQLGVDEPRLSRTEQLSCLDGVEELTARPDAIGWEEFVTSGRAREAGNLLAGAEGRLIRAIVVEKDGRRYAPSPLVVLYACARSPALQEWWNAVFKDRGLLDRLPPEMRWIAAE
jgi:hypothetical protein